MVVDRKVKFSQSALQDLQAIEEYICENNCVSARKIISHIIERVETLLVRNPGIGRAGRVLRTREFVISKYPYVIPYQVREDVIYILRVLHTSRKWDLK